MHGLRFRRTSTTNTKPLGVQPLKEGGNMVKSADGKYFTYQQDIDEIYAGNPYFKKKVIEQTEPYKGLQKVVPEDRKMQNREDMEPAYRDAFGVGHHLRQKQTLDDLYKGNPYYKTAMP